MLEVAAGRELGVRAAGAGKWCLMLKDHGRESDQTLLDGALAYRVKYNVFKESVHSVPGDWTGQDGGSLHSRPRQV